jgi:hypothetical protein
MLSVLSSCPIFLCQQIILSIFATLNLAPSISLCLLTASNKSCHLYKPVSSWFTSSINLGLPVHLLYNNCNYAILRAPSMLFLTDKAVRFVVDYGLPLCQVLTILLWSNLLTFAQVVYRWFWLVVSPVCLLYYSNQFHRKHSPSKIMSEIFEESLNQLLPSSAFCVLSCRQLVQSLYSGTKDVLLQPILIHVLIQGPRGLSGNCPADCPFLVHSQRTVRCQSSSACTKLYKTVKLSEWAGKSCYYH